MSLNSFAPELLMELLSHLVHIPTKIRMERVSKKFRDCIRNQESWKYNSELKIDETSTGHQVHAFLSHAKVITSLSLVDCGELDAQVLSPLWAFANKLKIDQFTYHPDEVCAENNQVVACCLGSFCKSLKTVALHCCWLHTCNLLTTFAKSLPFCTNLEHVTLGRFPPDSDNVINSLVNLPLKTLAVEHFNSAISGERLAAVCNTAIGHSLHEISVQNVPTERDLMQFNLNQFCQSLESGAAQAIKSLQVEYVDCSFVQLLPTLPTLLPNLSTFKLKDVLYNPNPKDAMQIAEALGSFMHACLQRENNIKFQFTVRSGDAEFKTWFWNAINLVDVARGGTKRTENMEQWKRTLDNGIASIDIHVK